MADNSKRGLASADEETRQRVASEGGQASHGGGRQADEQTNMDIDMTSNEEESSEGRGWHGDPEGHAEAGSQSSGNQGNPEQHAESGSKGGSR